jgi:succinate dehydrogenase/fumarate reductase flavoprotein subunit
MWFPFPRRNYRKYPPQNQELTVILEYLSCDLLIIGSGAAGLRAAIAARQYPLDVLVISKASPGKGTCTIVSGGVFAGTKQGDEPTSHIKRTLQAGKPPAG